MTQHSIWYDMYYVDYTNCLHNDSRHCTLKLTYYVEYYL